jgi:putative DNA primase/helicase
MSGGHQGPRQGGGGLPPIDFASLAEALLARAEQLVSLWLPNGMRRGHEWVCGGLDGGAGESLSVNLTNGRWADFAHDGDKGGDLTSLYAAINGLNNGQAAARLMDELGWKRAPVQAPAPPPRSPAPAAEPAVPSQRDEAETRWRVVLPVPEHAPKPTFQHHSRKLDTLTASWEYRFGDVLYGYVARWQTSDGGKEVLPLTWCEDTQEGPGQGTQRWHWKQWPVPRPLYVPATLLAADPALVPVVLVEGEKCAKAGFDLLPAEYDWASWPGGGNAWDKADWPRLQGRVVVLWPDCDAKREKLTNAERAAGVDPASKPLLPEKKQPGMKAMLQIGTRLLALGCTVLLVKVPRPGEVRDGWDVADAIADGWGPEEVRAMLRSAVVFETPEGANAQQREGISTPSGAGADTQGDDGGSPPRSAYWRDELIYGKTGPLSVRENLVAAMDGVMTRSGVWLPGVKAMQGVIAFNEFSNDVIKLIASPWGTPAGRWIEGEELTMGEWLVRRHGLPPCSRTTLEEAVRMVAIKHAFHPVREYLTSLPAWDGERRLHMWLVRACLEEDEHDARAPLTRYLARVGTWFLQAMVARVMQPGCKFDYMLILEGLQGRRKSTLLKTLGHPWSSDTSMVLGEKDSYQAFQGRWIHEFSELDSFAKAEATKIKGVVASCNDYFRASFDRRTQEYPRQIVFAGTTNEDHYLNDSTGNRRFWPVRVTRVIDVEWVEANRDQLFAEALRRWKAGERMYPTAEEEAELFVPQQRGREVENAIATAVATYLDSEQGELVQEATTVQILGKIGIGVEKLGPGRFHEKQAAAALRALGWTEGARSAASVPGRPRKWVRPSREAEPYQATPGAKQRAPQAHDDNGGLDACPF